MNNSNITKDGHDAHNGTGELFFIVGFLFATFAFTTNLLVSIVLSAKRKLREQTYTFLVMTLSLADLLVSTGVLSQIITDRFVKTFVYLCGIWSLLFSQGLFMSVYFTFVISLNCYVAAASTTWSGKLFGGSRKYAILFVPSTIIAFVNTGFYLYVGVKGHMTSCSLKEMFGTYLATQNMIRGIQTIPVILATFILCALAMRAVHMRYGSAGQSHISTIGTSSQCVADTRRKRHMTALKTLGMIFALSVILTAPYLIFNAFVSTYFEVASSSSFRAILSFGAFLKSAINPVVYTWRLKDFRNEISKMCCQCCCV